jgi:hypothetical protein
MAIINVWKQYKPCMEVKQVLYESNTCLVRKIYRSCIEVIYVEIIHAFNVNNTGHV